MVRHFRLFVSAAAGLAVVAVGPLVHGQQNAAVVPIAQQFEWLHFRSIGPASMSGRISDFAVYEANPSIFYVGSAHGGVWKTDEQRRHLHAASSSRTA